MNRSSRPALLLLALSLPPGCFGPDNGRVEPPTLPIGIAGPFDGHYSGTWAQVDCPATASEARNGRMNIDVSGGSFTFPWHLGAANIIASVSLDGTITGRPDQGFSRLSGRATNHTMLIKVSDGPDRCNLVIEVS